MMIKKQQKWISLVVLCTFAWLLQASVMPLNAAGAGEQVRSAGSEQGPDSYEAVGHKAAPAKKKSLLPIILIGAGALTLTAVALFVWPGVLKTKYDVTGSWVFVFTGSIPVVPRQTDFSGTKENGTWVWTHGSNTYGTYTVDGKNLTMVPGGGVWTATIVGTFTDKDAMSGTWTQSGNTWNWTATRGTGLTHVDTPASQAPGLEK
jgi:hypothetical protein